jgi:Arc/MetJ family transcription regulator
MFQPRVGIRLDELLRAEVLRRSGQCRPGRVRVGRSQREHVAVFAAVNDRLEIVATRHFALRTATQEAEHLGESESLVAVWEASNVRSADLNACNPESAWRAIDE